MATAKHYGAGTMSELSPGSGQWRLRVFVGRDPLTGHPLQVSKSFKGTEPAARKQLARFVSDVESGKFNRTRVTVGELLDRWLDHITPSRRPSTIAGYKAKIEHAIRPAVGNVKLAKLGPAELDARYKAWLDQGLAPATVRGYHAILSAALHQAERWGYIERSPASRTSPPTSRNAPMKVPTVDQMSDLVRAAEATDPLLATAVALAALTGLRRGELLALRWSDVDLDLGSVNVERAITVIEGKTHIGPTKTHQVRRVALDEVGTELLRKRWDDMVELSQRAESPMVDDPYILSTNANGGRPVNPDTLTHKFSSLCRTLEAPARARAKKQGREIKDSERWPFRLHDLRHFSVTTLIAAGVDIRTVSERHGHAQATMTLNRYAHALPARDRAAAGILGRALDSGATRDKRDTSQAS